jgi:hypothetical protein
VISSRHGTAAAAAPLILRRGEMTLITTFTVCEEEAGWYVDGPSRIGPFTSRAGAIQLAEELASFIRNDGEDAEVVYAPRPH